jgi:hypothetical protein
MSISYHTYSVFMLENQLFAPTLKGVIDFGFAELDPLNGSRFFAPFRVRG